MAQITSPEPRKSKPEKEDTSNEQDLASKRVRKRAKTPIASTALVEQKIPKSTGKFIALLIT